MPWGPKKHWESELFFLAMINAMSSHQSVPTKVLKGLAQDGFWSLSKKKITKKGKEYLESKRKYLKRHNPFGEEKEKNMFDLKTIVLVGLAYYVGKYGFQTGVEKATADTIAQTNEALKMLEQQGII